MPTKGINTRYRRGQYPVPPITPVVTILTVVKHAELMDNELSIIHELIEQDSDLGHAKQ